MITDYVANNANAVLPKAFLKLLNQYLSQVDPSEDQTGYLNNELKINIQEDKPLPNTLLQMQEPAHAPYGHNSGVTKEMFISEIKTREASMLPSHQSLDFEFLEYNQDTTVNKSYEQVMNYLRKPLRSPQVAKSQNLKLPAIRTTRKQQVESKLSNYLQNLRPSISLESSPI